MQQRSAMQQRQAAGRRAAGAPVVRRSTRVAAGPKTATATTTTTTTTTTTPKNGGKMPGFRWNPGMQRWERSKNGELAQDSTATLIKPMLSGAAYQAWPVVWATLDNAGLQSITVQEARELQGKGWTLVDVRVADDFEKQHCEGAVNLPLYRRVAGTGFFDKLKVAVMAVGFAMKATERNPDFQADALQKLRKNQKVLLICSIGGTLDTNVKYRREKKIFADPDRSFGRDSRSLKAAYELLEAGWSAGNMRHVEGGLSQWRYDGLPLAAGPEEE